MLLQMKQKRSVKTSEVFSFYHFIPIVCFMNYKRGEHYLTITLPSNQSKKTCINNL